MNEEQEMMMNIILSGWLIIALRHAFMKPSVMLLVKIRGKSRESCIIYRQTYFCRIVCIVFDNNND